MRILDNTGLVQDPFHLGAVILDKLIGDIKAKLPFLNKKKGGDDDADDEEDEGLDTATETEVGADIDDKTNVSKKPAKSPVVEDESDDEETPADNSLVGKIKAKLNSFKKPKAAAADEDEVTDVENATDAPKKDKKKPNFIVIGGAALLIGFILLSDFGDETPPAQTAPQLKPKGEKVKPPEDKPAEAAPTETKPAETATTETPVEAKPTEVTPTETSPTETTTTTTPVETAPTETPVETKPVETTTTETTTPVETAPTEAAPTETTTTTTEATPSETPPTETAPTATETLPTETTPSETATADSVNGEQAPTSDDNLTEKILEDLENQAKESQPKSTKQEYVSPPNYENVGRGLVYNCTGKHWACIDGPSYKTCEDNASGNKFLKKKVECYPFNVYETQGGCEKMQNRVVSSSAKTEFCSE